MNFSELCAEVVLITKRPDLQARTESAVRAALLKAHRSDLYARDLVEAQLAFTTPAYIQNLNPRTVIPQYRQVKYFRQFDGVNPDFLMGPVFENIQVENILDGYGYHKNNVYYMSGEVLQIRSSCLLSYGILGVYTDPVVIQAGFKSWIARDFPWVVIYEAARQIMQGIGFADRAQQLTNSVREELAVLKMNCLDATPF